MTDLLAGKVAIVTGGGAGIGEAIAKKFAQNGAHVIVNGLQGDPVDAVVNEIHALGFRAVACAADVGTKDGADACVRAAIESFGRLDILIANAGIIGDSSEIQDADPKVFEEVIDNNMRSVFWSVRQSVPELRKSKGVIICAASESALKGFPQNAIYSASKGWILAFARSVAAEQARHGIRCNVVAPGPIDTEMTRPKGVVDRATMALEVQSVPMGRRGTPEEVANVYLFLASDWASYLTGAVISVDGGATAVGGMLGFAADKHLKTPPEGSVQLEHQHEGRGTRNPD